MNNQNYQTVAVVDYLKLLDNEVQYSDNDAKNLRSSVEKYLLSTNRANTNAKILEAMLA